jgi:ferritin-like metal-binding protein YciE
MSITSKRELFDRELRKLYHAEIEILDLHSDLAAAAASDEVTAIFGGHEGDTVDQIDRIEEIFATVDMETREQGSPIMEGLIAQKDQFVLEIEDDELRDLDVINIGLINERLEITLLDRLILLADELDLSEPTIANLEANREEAQTALGRMQQYLEDRRVTY